jgi:hypothetical protein
MSAEARVCVRRVFIRIPSGSQDHIDWDATLQALLPKSKTFELLQAVLLGSAIDDGIPKELAAHTRVKYSGFARSAATSFINVLGVLELPRVAALVV